jgi:SAM domain (Sterile alpha motif)
MDVGAWLRSLSLNQYETLFHQNDVDAEVLVDLTDGDLEKLGVSLGHRKRLLKAIASLGEAQTPEKPASPGPTSPPADAAERHCQTKFYTACSRTRVGWSSAVFAHELSPRSAGFDSENGLYLFALTVPAPLRSALEQRERARLKHAALAELGCRELDRVRLGAHKKAGPGQLPSLGPRFQMGRSTRVGDVLEVAPVLMRRPSQVPGPAD